MRYFKIQILFPALLLLSTITQAQIPQQKSIDSIFSKWSNTNSPGCGLGIIKDGKLIYAKGYGMANLEHDIPNAANTVFRIGSTSKQFTAACIILLEQQGKLKLDNTLASFFPEFPDYAKRITIEHLLHHTSGIRDYLTLSYLKGMGADSYYEDKDIMRWLINQKRLNFEPGEEFLYSNSGYWLLGQIVNKVAGMNMSAYAKKELFEPLGMTQTQFYTDHTKIVKNRAAGYSPKKSGAFSIDMTTLGMIGDGGVLTSIKDIKKWDDAFYNSDVLNKAFWKKMTAQAKLNNGKEISYASGLIIGKRKGLKVVKHGGAFVGYRADIVRFPEQRFTVAIFANRSDANPTRMAYKVADVFLKELYKKEKPKSVKPVVADKNSQKITLNEIAGNYELQPNAIFVVKKVNDSLQVTQKWNGAKFFLKRTKGNTFFISEQAGIEFTFSGLENGKAQVATILQGGSEQVCKRAKDIDLSGIKLADYVGQYFSSELDMTYAVLLEKDQLKVKINNEEPMPMQAFDKDKFSISGLVLHFERDQGRVVKFKMEAGRVKDLGFIKK